SNTESYKGRAIKPEDNGNLSTAADMFPLSIRPSRGIAGKPVTQFEFARAGVITKEMIYVAERENLGRAMLADAASRIASGESFGAAIPPFITPE
ncbi:hypothetical protein ABTN40_19480, partial [Acinetobacter baumannii]